MLYSGFSIVKCSKQSETNVLLESNMEMGRETRFVLIDYKSGTVISNWLEPAAWTKLKQPEITP
jgi:hypothetical protein